MRKMQDMPESMGYPTPNPDCPRCHGAGFLYPLDQGKPDYSQVVPCKCYQNSLQGWILSPDALRGRGIDTRQTFDSFQVVNGTGEAYEAARDFASASCNIILFLLYGGVGNGKSFLCNATALVLLEKSIDTHLYSVADLLAELRQRIKDNTIEEKVQWLKEIPALILDDYKPEYQSEWAASRLEEIIDFRYRNLLLTMMTTNRNLTELPERITSRFSDNEIAKRVLNSGKDYRRRKQDRK